MNPKYFLCFLFLFATRSISYSQDIVGRNIDVINGLVDESFENLNNKFILLGEDSFYDLIFDSNQPEQLFLAGRIKNRFDSYKILTGEDSDSIDYNLVLKNPDIKIKYKKIYTDNVFGTKKILREVKVTYEMDFVDKKKSVVLYNQKFSKTVKDNFDLDKLNMVEDNSYAFSRSTLPDENSLDQFFYPAVIIAASAIAIILFFTIRSK